MQQPLGVHHVRLLLDVAEILGLGALVAQTLLVAVQDNIILADAAGDVFLPGEVDGLRDRLDIGGKILAVHRLLFTQHARQCKRGLLAHAVRDHVSPRVAKDAGAQAVLPVVVMGDAAQ